MTETNILHAPTAQDLLNQIVFEHYREKKRKRTWRIVRRTLIAGVLVAGLVLLVKMRAEDLASHMKPHVGIIDLKGEIADGAAASADNLTKSLRTAHESKGLKAVILRIDSPGGSPVQADYMFSTIRYFRKKYPEVKYYAVCMDSCTSAAYYVASATDEIYANPSSMVGSIGVVYNGFGFVDAMQKIGVSRRLEIAGRNKGFMDQFSPVEPNQVKSLQTMLDLIHQQFIKQVQLGRGKRLQPDVDLFSGMVWTGVQAQKLGLVDGFASTGQLMRDVIKIEVAMDYTEKHNVLDQLAKNFGAEMISQLPKALGIRPGIQ